MTTAHIEQGQFAIVPLADIVSSPTNPRKSFDPAKLAELADTIKASGVHTPILLRYLPASRLEDTFADRKKGAKLPQYEIVAGERRYRASVIAGAANIPALIRAMSDTQALEVQMIENLQRDDLSELEEAEGYQQLCDLTNIAKEALGEKIGRSRRYVYNRLRLLKLQPLARAALREGKIEATAALAIAAVHDGDLQAKALRFASQPHFNGEKPSTRELQKWMRSNVMLDLSRATFDIEQIDLNPTAGPCNTCPKRTGADPDILAETQGPDSCCDAPCYHAKTETSRALAHAKFTAQGIEIIEGDDADDLLTNNSFDGYSPVSQTREDTISGQPASLLDLLGKKGQQEVGMVAIEHPRTKELRAYVDTGKAEAWLLANKLVFAEAPPTKQAVSGNAANELKRLLEFKETRIHRAVEKAAAEAIEDAVAAAPARLMNTHLLTDNFLRTYIAVSFNEYSPGPEVKVFHCEREPGSSTETFKAQVTAAIFRASRGDLVRALILKILEDLTDSADTPELQAEVDEEVDYLHDTLKSENSTSLPNIRAAAELKECEIIDARIAELKALIEPKKAEKPLSPKPPLAQPSALPKQSKLPADAARPTLKPKKAKLTPEEAQLGIAFAMQGMEVNEGAAAPTNQGAVAPDEKQEVAAVAASFVPGQKVKVLSAEPGHLQKYIGKVGKIKKAVGENFDVTFHGKGIAEFEPQELEAVPA